MQKSIVFSNNRTLEYTLITSPRAKNMRISIHRDGRCVMTVPYRIFPITQSVIDSFLIKKSSWILKKIEYFTSFRDAYKNIDGTYKNVWNVHDPDNYQKYKKPALALVESRLAFFNKYYGYTWKRVSIKNQSTRWGSCSSKGNLNFNYKIALLPEKLADYIIVHELCHLGAFNHSQKFWDLVARQVPDHREVRKELKKYGLGIL